MRLSIISTLLLVASPSISVHAKKKHARRCVAKGGQPQSLVQISNGSNSTVSLATSSASRTRTRTHSPTATTSSSAFNDNGDQGNSTSASPSSTLTNGPSSTSSSKKGSKTTSTSSSSSSASPNNDGGNSSNSTSNGPAMNLVDDFSGSSFFDNWDFNDFPDPTHGFVKYLDQDKATSAGLAYVQDDGTVVMKVDNTNTYPSGGQRPSVRISSKNSYTSGLIVLDVQAMPYGCGVWPAFWTVGGDWPSGGEIDIVEGVNNNDNNQYTLHTSDGCTLDTSFAKSASKKRRHGKQKGRRGKNDGSSNAFSAMAFTGKALATTCDAAVNGNSGCGIQDPSDVSYGQGLNNNGGGVFATLLNDDGVAIWFFPRDSIPSDLQSKNPAPSGWGSPKAFWSSDTCPTGKFFGPQNIVINTTLCGDWAGNAYSSDGSCPGTCADQIQDPQNFDTAQWKINSVRVYS